MQNLHITLAMAVSGLRAVIGKFGTGHVATNPNGGAGCTYYVLNDDLTITPVCIVGQYLHNLGLLRLLVDESNECVGSTCTPHGAVWRTLEGYGVTVDESAAAFLRKVQSAQDSGTSWGEAFNGAIPYAQTIAADAVNAAADAVIEQRRLLNEQRAYVETCEQAHIAAREDAEALGEPLDLSGLADWERELLNGI